MHVAEANDEVTHYTPYLSLCKELLVFEAGVENEFILVPTHQLPVATEIDD